VFRSEGGEGKRESCDSKLILLLAAFGYVVGVRNVWCCCNRYRRVVWLASEGGGAAAIKGGRVKGDKMNILNFKFMFCSQNVLNY
jgi:hypothetical protein